MGLLGFWYLCLCLCDCLCQCECVCVLALCFHVWLPLRVCPRGIPDSHLTGQRRCTRKEIDAVSRRVQGNSRVWGAAVLRRQPRLTIANKKYTSQYLRRICDVDRRRLAGFKMITPGNGRTLLSGPKRAGKESVVDVTKACCLVIGEILKFTHVLL